MKRDVQEGTVGFSINNCPLGVYEEFVNFCKQETSDNYSFGIKLLLESRRTNVKEVVLYQKLDALQAYLEKLEERIKAVEKNK